VAASASRERRAFTLVEMLTVIAIIGLLAGLIVGLAGFAGRRMKEGRIRGELLQLETAIKAYHAKFGHYPPDHVVSRSPLVVDPATPPLFYELVGCVLQGKEFFTHGPDERVTSADAQRFFGVDGFVNAATDEKALRPFLQLNPKQYTEISQTPDIDVLIVSAVPWPKSLNPQPVPAAPGVNPWRYVSTSPTNNPGTFDLWAEYLDGKKIKIISNWSKDVLDK
jgi:prepilin-type N-terminal cleavage/methylation domain-containing protein